jgi:hypothetical protein
MQPWEFYAAILNAGTILWGFNGTFLAFRLQREAAYRRQPVLDFNTASGKDVDLNLQRLSWPFLILLSCYRMLCIVWVYLSSFSPL